MPLSKYPRKPISLVPRSKWTSPQAPVCLWTIISATPLHNHDAQTPLDRCPKIVPGHKLPRSENRVFSSTQLKNFATLRSPHCTIAADLHGGHEALPDLLRHHLVDAGRPRQHLVIEGRGRSELHSAVLRVQRRHCHGVAAALVELEVLQAHGEQDQEVALLQRRGEQLPGRVHEPDVHLALHHGDHLGRAGVRVRRHQRQALRVECRVVHAREPGDDADAQRVVGGGGSP